jgi:hypothetical protein
MLFGECFAISTQGIILMNPLKLCTLKVCCSFAEVPRLTHYR